MTLARSPLTTLMGWCAILIVMAGSSLLSGAPIPSGTSAPSDTSAPSGRPVASDPGSDDLESLVTLMARIGACYSPSFSPGGDRLAFICTLSGSPQVWTAPVEGGWPTQVTAYEDPVGKGDRLRGSGRQCGLVAAR
jgi:hypothetical protein